jgi:hypothetical protein
VNFDKAEKEKSDFVGDGFIKCFANFLDFKEGETYWLEYIGDDKYNVRSDNLLGKIYHITPCQLYTVFKKLTWLEKQSEQKPADKVEPKFKVGDEIRTKNEESLIITRIDRCGYWSEDLFICNFDDADKWELVEQKPAWSEEDECNIQVIDSVLFYDKNLPEDTCMRLRNWLESLKQRLRE